MLDKRKANITELGMRALNHLLIIFSLLSLRVIWFVPVQRLNIEQQKREDLQSQASLRDRGYNDMKLECEQLSRRVNALTGTQHCGLFY